MIYDIYTYNGRSDLYRFAFYYYHVRNPQVLPYASHTGLLYSRYFSSWLCDLWTIFIHGHSNLH